MKKILIIFSIILTVLLGSNFAISYFLSSTYKTLTKETLVATIYFDKFKNEPLQPKG